MIFQNAVDTKMCARVRALHALASNGMFVCVRPEAEEAMPDPTRRNSRRL
jgi:hypothetical protein